jgi:hypothetical protein
MTIADRDAKVVYLEDRPFTTKEYYSIEITDKGATVYSECCADTMSVETATAVHEALGRYLADAQMERP